MAEGSFVVGGSGVAACVVGAVCAAAGVILASIAASVLNGRTITTARSRCRRLVITCAWSALLLSVFAGVVVLVATSASRLVGFVLLVMPLIVVAACVVVVSLLQVRRYGRRAWLAVLLGTAGLLLVCGVGGVNGPEPLPLPGLLCLLWIPAPLIGCAFLASRGLRTSTPVGVARRTGAAVVAVAAGFALTGFAAQIVHNSSAYAVHYGTVATMGLPSDCTVVMFTDDSVPAHCEDETWFDRVGNPTTGTVYTDHQFWDRYGKYYGPGRIAVDPSDAAPPSIKITVYAIGNRAYMPGDTTTSARDAIGTPPLPLLAWAGLAIPAVFVMMLGGWMNRHRRVIADAERVAFRPPPPAWRADLVGLGAAAVLAGLGIAGIRSPDPWQLLGLVCLLLAAAPLAATVFIRLDRRGGPRMTTLGRLACGGAALSAVATATGAAAAIIAHNGMYTQRYGTAATMKLPRTCHLQFEPRSGKTADITACTHVTWTAHGQTAHGTLHVSRRFWNTYGSYYDDVIITRQVELDPSQRYFAAKRRVSLRVSGHDAYPAEDRSIAALGRPPLPWLSTAALPLTAALLTGYFGGRRARTTPAGTGADAYAYPSSRPSSRVRPVTETSDFVRVSVDASGLRVQRRTRTAANGHSAWRDHVNLTWDQISRVSFADERHGPTILYVLTDGGTRLYALDRRQLTGEQWRTIAKAVSTATGGRITLTL